MICVAPRLLRYSSALRTNSVPILCRRCASRTAPQTDDARCEIESGLIGVGSKTGMHETDRSPLGFGDNQALRIEVDLRENPAFERLRGAKRIRSAMRE